MNSYDLGGTGVLSDILIQGIEAGTISRADIREATGASEATVSRWVHGEVEPGYCFVRLMARNLPEAVALRLLQELAGNRFAVLPSGSPCGDLNGDGKTDVSDALEGSVQLSERAVTGLREIHDAIGDGELSQSEALHINGMLNEVSSVLRRLRVAVEASAVERRKARPVSAVGRNGRH